MAVEVRVYGPSGAGAYVTLARRRGVQWLDELDAVGFGSVQVHASDPAATAANLAHGRVVKLVYSGAERFAFRIEKRETQVVSAQEEAGRWITLSGRGLLSLLGDAVVYPEQALTRTSADERFFTFASVNTTDWYVAGEWAAPVGVLSSDDTTARGTLPADFPDAEAQWIWSTSPNSDSPGGTVNYFRSTFTLDAVTLVTFYVTADNSFALWLNGEPVLASDEAEVFLWRTTSTYVVSLPAGTHTVAVRAVNAVTADDAANSAGLRVAIASTNSDGSPDTYLRRTDTTNWLVHTGTPGWRAAHVMKKLLTEAQGREVTACTYLTYDFTADVDSAAVAWTDRQDVAVRIGVESVLDVATKLAESAVDVNVTPGMVLQGWKRRGADKTATVTLAAGMSLVDHKATSTAATATRALVRTGAGWVEVSDTAGETASGRKETGLSLGTAQSVDAATTVAQSVFVETSTAQTVIESAQMPARTGATPYVDFGVGDDIRTAGEDGDVTVRVSALSCVEDEDGLLLFTPELYA